MKISPKRLIVIAHAGIITLLLAALTPTNSRLSPAQADQLPPAPELEFLADQDILGLQDTHFT